MSFHRAISWEERGLQVQAIKNKCNHIIDRLALSEDDVRTLGMVHVRQLCNTLASVPIKLQQNAEVSANVRVIISLLGIKNVQDLKSCLCDLNKNAKISFVTMVQFALENCIERVLDALQREKALGSFAKSSKHLINVAGLQDPGYKHQLISVPAWTRNALHNGGIHRKSGKKVLIDGELFVFEKDKRVECASWSHLLHAFLHGLEVYEQMFVSPAVASVSRIKGP